MGDEIEAAEIQVAPGANPDVKAPLEALELKANDDQVKHVQLKSQLDRIPTWQSIRVFHRAIIVCSVAGFCATLDGYQNQMVGSIVANKGFIHHFAHGGKKLEPKWVSTFNGLYNAGLVVGQLSAQWVSERFGRKICIYLVVLVLLVATVIEVTAKEWYVWTIAKAVAGIGVGAIQASLPVYISEQAISQIRGVLIVAYSLWWNVGAVLGAVTLEAVALRSPMAYRTPLYTQFGMSALIAVLFVFLPESPWWAARKGKISLARSTLQRQFGKVPGYDVDKELSIILATIEQQRLWDEQAKVDGTFAIFKGLMGKRFLICSYPKVLQQLVGLSVFSSNSSYFFQLAGYANPFQESLIISCTGVFAVICDASLVDKIGRRRMILIGFGGACFGVTLIAIIGCLNYQNHSLGSVLVFGGVLANFFNTFEASTSFAYLTEVPELRFRARAAGWGLAFSNLFAILINFTLPLMLDKWSVRCAFFFVVLGIPGTILAYFIMPETMGRSPSEIQEMFVDRVPLRTWKGYRTIVERDLDAQLTLEGH